MTDRAQARIVELEREVFLLKRVIEMKDRQIKSGGWEDEVRRLRAKIAEWEGSSRYINGGYHHGSRFIMPYVDEAEE
jgi:hypothetical protein